tara:strand:+ start:253 stop:405 length:153 start_codon:yes stop_codon:yes gene_type:complete
MRLLTIFFIGLLAINISLAAVVVPSYDYKNLKAVSIIYAEENEEEEPDCE